MINNYSETIKDNFIIKNYAPIQPQDSYYMLLAIDEAKKGLYTTRPNPAVGCIIVKDNEVIGRGFHPKAGEPHAEIFALKEAESKTNQLQSATAYVTLEPCSHTGRTPPCARVLIKSGIKRVVIAGLDPNEKVSGRGVQMLIDAGIKVLVGVCRKQAEQLNLGFLKAMRTQMPYVRLKIATSLDGRTAMLSGESKWITGNESREDVQHLRALSGAIITGSQTIIDDDPSLSVRSTQLGVPVSEIPQPKVVILDRRKRLKNANHKVLHHPDTLLYEAKKLNQLLISLVKEFHIYDVLIEAGSNVSGSFVKAGLVDELIVYQAPCILGHTAQPMLNLQLDELSNQHRFSLVSATKMGEDLKLVFEPLY